MCWPQFTPANIQILKLKNSGCFGQTCKLTFSSRFALKCEISYFLNFVSFWSGESIFERDRVAFAFYLNTKFGGVIALSRRSQTSRRRHKV